jgi:hypothetical protein
MDPKDLAEKIMSQIFDNNETIHEAKDPNEEEDEEGDDYEDEGDEDEGDEDDSEDESEESDSEPTPGGQNKTQGGVARGAQSLQMKPSSASAEMGGASGGRGDSSANRDANGGGTVNPDGKGFQTTTPTVDSSEAMRSSLNMKPSFSSPQMPMFDRGQVAEDIKVMFGGSDELSEEFVNKAADIYEATMLHNLGLVTESLIEQFQGRLEETVQVVAEKQEQNIDEYLGYVVEEWMKENKLAAESGLRTEIAENFISGLLNLFTESYIEIPEDRVNAFDEMAIAVSSLEERVSAEMKNNVALIQEIKNLKATAIFEEETKTLSNVAAEKMRGLVENLNFDNADSFRGKVQTLVEGFQKKTSAPKMLKEINHDSTVSDEPQEDVKPEVSNVMQMYMNTLDRTLKQ